jgi:hypothetical protein
MRRLIAAALITVAFAAQAASQAYAPPKPTRQLELMEAVAWLDGEWEGSGWVQMGPERHAFSQTESVTRRLDGLILVIDGLGRAADSGEVVHSAFAVVRVHEGEYRISAYTHHGQYLDVPAQVAPGTLVWGFRGPQGQIRFTITHTESDEWHEIGEATQDGEKWFQFLEMRLGRAGAAAASN